MSAQTYIYNRFLEEFSKNSIDFEWHEIYGALLTPAYIPDIDQDEVWSDISSFEISPGAAYTTGGKKLVDPVFVRDDSSDKIIISWNPLRWEVPDGESLPESKGIVLYDTSIVARPLIAFMDFGVPVSVSSLTALIVTPVVEFVSGGA